MCLCRSSDCREYCAYARCACCSRVRTAGGRRPARPSATRSSYVNAVPLLISGHGAPLRRGESSRNGLPPSPRACAWLVAEEIDGADLGVGYNLKHPGHRLAEQGKVELKVLARAGKPRGLRLAASGGPRHRVARWLPDVDRAAARLYLYASARSVWRAVLGLAERF